MTKHWQNLHPDLVGCLEQTPAGLDLNHPLMLRVDEHTSAELNCWYEKKLDALDGAAERRDFYTWVFTHERPYRVSAFSEIDFELPGTEFWSLLSDIWVDSENIWQDQTLWRQLWNDARPGKDHAMDPNGREAFKDLPDDFTVYRGVRDGCNVHGLCWTPEKRRSGLPHATKRRYC